MMTPYHAFLLRLWRFSDTEPPRWRVSLENPHTHEVLGFDDLATLAGYLQSLTGETSLAGAGGTETWALPPGGPGASGSPR